MTDEPFVEAAPSAPAGLTFADNIANLQVPRNWELHAWDTKADEITEEPHVRAALPISTGDTMAQHLARAGATRGRWRVALAPVVAGPKARHRLNRLQAKGMVADFVDVSAEDVASAQRSRDGSFAASTKVVESRPANVSDSVRAALEAAELQRAENARLSAKLEAQRIMAQLEDVQSKKAGGGSGIVAMLAPFAPVVVDFVRGWIENQRRSTEALTAAVMAREPAPAAPAAAPAMALTIESLLSLVPQVKQLAKLVGGFGGGSDGDDEPRNETVRMIEGVRDLLAGLRGEAAAQAPAAAPTPMPRERPSPQAMMNFRVTKWLTAVMNEQSVQADPAHAAEKLFPAIGALPESFRQLIATSENVETLLTGLPRWLPPGLKTTVPNTIRNDKARSEWLSVFLQTVREIATEAGARAEGDGEDVGQAG